MKFQIECQKELTFSWPNNSWNKLDRIVVSKNLRNRRGIELKPETFRIVPPPFAMKATTINDTNNFYYGTSNPRVPFKSNYMPNSADERGYSDHMPVVVKLKI